jgi:hypothetical protein
MRNLIQSNNEPAPLFTLNNVEGKPVSLATGLMDQQSTLLVFLRHLG